MLRVMTRALAMMMAERMMALVWATTMRPPLTMARRMMPTVM